MVVGQTGRASRLCSLPVAGFWWGYWQSLYALDRPVLEVKSQFRAQEHIYCVLDLGTIIVEAVTNSCVARAPKASTYSSLLRQPR